jgi:hypothetical protein
MEYFELVIVIYYFSFQNYGSHESAANKMQKQLAMN